MSNFGTPPNSNNSSGNKRPHRIILFRQKGVLKRWRYRVLSGNHKVVDAPEQAFVRKSYALRRAQERWPDAEVIDLSQK